MRSPSVRRWGRLRWRGVSSSITSESTRRAPARGGVDMSCFYRRGKSLWIAFNDERGKRVCRPTGYKVGQEEAVRALLAELDRKAAEASAAPAYAPAAPVAVPAVPVTVPAVPVTVP